MAKKLTPQQRMWRAVSEKDFMATVIRFAALNGWKHYHPPDNKPSAGGWSQKIVAGFPDLCLIRVPDIMFVELKSEIGTTTVEQDVWLQSFRDCGIVTHVWRPSQIEQILRILQRGPNGA